MKLLILILLIVSGSVHSQVTNDYYLTPKEQVYFKNDSNEGNNQFERINMNVRELNKLHAELTTLKAEVLLLKKEIADLKKKGQ
jgi:hypothetical protein